LGEEILVARMQSLEEEHHLQDERNCHRRLGKCVYGAFEPGTELMEPLLITLGREGKEGGERVRDWQWAEIIFKQLGHLEALAVESWTCVLKKKPNRTIFEGGLKVLWASVMSKESSWAVEKPGEQSQKRVRLRERR
jgi:hypothetical protein